MLEDLGCSVQKLMFVGCSQCSITSKFSRIRFEWTSVYGYSTALLLYCSLRQRGQEWEGTLDEHLILISYIRAEFLIGLICVMSDLTRRALMAMDA